MSSFRTISDSNSNSKLLAENPGANFEIDGNLIHFQWNFVVHFHDISLSEEIPCQNTINLSLFLSPSPPAVLYPPRVSLFPPAVSLLLFLPFPFALSYSSSSFRIAWRGGPAARLTVLGASYTFTPVCAFFRERTCPFHVPLERARYIYPPFIKYVYTNGQQTDVVDPIVSGASRYLEDSWAELRTRSPIVEFWNHSPFVRTIVYFDIQSTVRARQWYGTTDQRQAVQIRRVPLGLSSARRQGFRHATRRAKGELIWDHLSDSLYYVGTSCQLRYLFPSILSTMIWHEW